MAGPTLGERVTRLEEWHTNHETHCDERQQAMGREIRDLKGGVNGLTKGAWGIVLALLAWTAAQLWDGLKADAGSGVQNAVASQPK
ncbi:hypothetical protein [Phenylobacterium sp.]|jgi:hypothetical protein|uniref:hypothetical protein n=1 Tax=Phenylobacterium sp. TaxID=1871053 RepID=UPI0037CA7D97